MHFHLRAKVLSVCWKGQAGNTASQARSGRLPVQRDQEKSVTNFPCAINSPLRVSLIVIPAHRWAGRTSVTSAAMLMTSPGSAGCRNFRETLEQSRLREDFPETFERREALTRLAGA